MGFSVGKFRATIARQPGVIVHINKDQPNMLESLEVAQRLEKEGLVTIKSGHRSWKVKATEKALKLWGIEQP